MNFKDFGDSLIRLASGFYGVEVTIGVLTPDNQYPTYSATFVTLDGYKLPSNDSRILCKADGRTAEEAVEALGEEFKRMIMAGFASIANAKRKSQEGQPEINTVNKDYSLN